MQRSIYNWKARLLSRKARSTAWLAVYALAVLLLDLQLELGVSVGMFYCLVVWAAVMHQDKRAPWLTATACTALILIGFGFSSDGGEAWKVLLNRAGSIVMLWVCAWWATTIDTLQKNLGADEARNAALINACSDAVITMDRNGWITSWNEEATRLFGWTAQEAIGKNLATLIVPPKQRRKHDEGLVRFLRRGDSRILGHDIRTEGCNREGKRLSLMMTIRALRLPNRIEFAGYLRAEPA